MAPPRPPHIHHGTASGTWAILFGVLIFVGAILLDLDKATAFIIALVSAGAIFLFVRLRGEEDLSA